MSQETYNLRTLSEQAVERLKTSKISAKELEDFLDKISSRPIADYIPLHLSSNGDHCSPAVFNVTLTDQSFFTIIPHYEKTVGEGIIVGYSVLNHRLPHAVFTEISNTVRASEKPPASICDLLPEGHPIYFSVEN